MPYNHLSAEEERVIVYKGTERQFTGEYETLYSPGTFICRRCNNPLYSAEAKFKSGGHLGHVFVDDRPRELVFRTEVEDDSSRTGSNFW